MPLCSIFLRGLKELPTLQVLCSTTALFFSKIMSCVALFIAFCSLFLANGGGEDFLKSCPHHCRSVKSRSQILIPKVAKSGFALPHFPKNFEAYRAEEEGKDALYSGASHSLTFLTLPHHIIFEMPCSWHGRGCLRGKVWFFYDQSAFGHGFIILFILTLSFGIPLVIKRMAQIHQVDETLEKRIKMGKREEVFPLFFNKSKYGIPVFLLEKKEAQSFVGREKLGEVAAHFRDSSHFYLLLFSEKDAPMLEGIIQKEEEKGNGYDCKEGGGTTELAIFHGIKEEEQVSSDGEDAFLFEASDSSSDSPKFLTKPVQVIPIQDSKKPSGRYQSLAPLVCGKKKSMHDPISTPI